MADPCYRNVKSIVPYHASDDASESSSSFREAQLAEIQAIALPIKLLIAAQEGREEVILESLVGKPVIDLTQIDAKGNTILHYACLKGMSQAIPILLKARAPINHANHIGKTALHLLCKQELPKTLKIMIENGASLDVTDDQDNSPLHIASESGKLGMVKILSKKAKKSLDQVNKNQETPLALAIINSHSKVAEKLLDRGADPTITDRNGKAAFDLAVEKKLPDELLNKIKNLVKTKTGTIPMKIKEAAEKLLKGSHGPEKTVRDDN